MSGRVVLIDGTILDLQDSQDTGRDHMGVLVYATDDGEPDYVPWRLVDTIALTQ